MASNHHKHKGIPWDYINVKTEMRKEHRDRKNNNSYDKRFELKPQEDKAKWSQDRLFYVPQDLLHV